jgi:hypothetical protein
VISFYSAHSSQINSALAACPSLTSLVANPVCSSSTVISTGSTGAATATTTSTATGTAKGSGTSSASASPSTSVVSTGGASGKQGLVGLIGVGVLGAVVALL